MTRPWRNWLVYIVSFGTVLAALAWVSTLALRVEEATARIAANAEHEERIRLALWRLDSSFSPLIAGESSRPFFVYRAFYEPGRAYNRMFNDIASQQDVLVPSPLLTLDSPLIHLHFQIEPDGEFTSPQVPVSNMRDLAEAKIVDPARIIAAEEKLEQLEAKISRESVMAAVPRAQTRQKWVLHCFVDDAWSNVGSASQQASEADAGEPAPRPAPQQLEVGNQAEQQARQTARSSIEYNARRRVLSKMNTQQSTRFLRNSPTLAPEPTAGQDIAETPMLAVWLDDVLLLVRRVRVGAEDYLQGCWLNWEAVQASLREDLVELFPDAELRPVKGTRGEQPGHTLASVPVEIAVGEPPAFAIEPLWSVRAPLAIAWGGVLIAALAVALLLSGAIQLSERRGAFVSAVTHELRTPLTTFQLYTEMLSEGMVDNPEKQRSYLDTLRTEADRLGHMVENVLAYARLEKGRQAGRIERVELRQIVDKVVSRLANRAEQAGLELVVDFDERDDLPDGQATAVRTDPVTTEQILLNLVDNACKYGAGGEDRRIELSARRQGEHVCVDVRDHGKGVSPEMQRKLFQAFSKSAGEAARSAPGVGLGLAISRRLARAVGGDLRLEKNSTDGATFTVCLPAV